MKRLSILLALLLCLLTACGGNGDIEAYLPEINELYFYGVAESGGEYYARVLKEYKDDPAEDEYLYVPLADEISAFFQPEGWVGAWSPDQYLTAKELARAYEDGKIAQGALFTFSITDGCMVSLNEHNYYADSKIDLTTGEVITQ